MLEYGLLRYLQRVCAVAHRSVNHRLGGTHRGFEQTLPFRVFPEKFQYFTVMRSDLLDKLLIVLFFTAHLY